MLKYVWVVLNMPCQSSEIRRAQNNLLRDRSAKNIVSRPVAAAFGNGHLNRIGLSKWNKCVLSEATFYEPTKIRDPILVFLASAERTV